MDAVPSSHCSSHRNIPDSSRHLLALVTGTQEARRCWGGTGVPRLCRSNTKTPVTAVTAAVPGRAAVLPLSSSHSCSLQHCPELRDAKAEHGAEVTGSPSHPLPALHPAAPSPCSTNPHLCLPQFSLLLEYCSHLLRALAEAPVWDYSGITVFPLHLKKQNPFDDTPVVKIIFSLSVILQG